VVVSVGTNSYGHPRQEAMSAYAAVAEGVYRTDLHGHVTVLGYPDGRFEVFSGADLVAEGRERGSAVWNNDGDTATLYDRSGTVVLRYTYE
jgi:hypothetical protein